MNVFDWGSNGLGLVPKTRRPLLVDCDRNSCSRFHKHEAARQQFTQTQREQITDKKGSHCVGQGDRRRPAIHRPSVAHRSCRHAPNMQRCDWPHDGALG